VIFRKLHASVICPCVHYIQKKKEGQATTKPQLINFGPK